MSASSIPVEGELTLFRPKKFVIKRRVATRYRSGPATLGKVVFPKDGNSHESVVHNLSQSGIGLSMNFPVEVGQEIVITLRLAGEPAARRFFAHVVHVTPEVDQTWRVGCEFAEPLDDDLLDKLLE